MTREMLGDRPDRRPANYDPKRIEEKWQERWAGRGTNSWTDDALRVASRPFYNLMMIPYPSAEGLHVGNMYAFTGADVGAWTDRVVPLAAAFGAASPAFVAAVLAEDDDQGRAAVADAFLAERVPGRDTRYDEVLAMVDDIRTDPALTSVEAVSRRHAVSGRTLQRLFRRYVGVGPKWVIQRARLHDAVDRIDAGDYADLATLAVELGWFDQAHFTRDFTALVGQPPAAYAAPQ